MTTALWITLIGMSMVFAVILLLWGVMALLVWATSSHEPAAVGKAVSDAPSPTGAAETAAGGQSTDLQRRAAAAAVAVAVALNMEKDTHKNGAAATSARASAPAAISPWQAAHRAAQVNRMGIGPKPGGKR